MRSLAVRVLAAALFAASLGACSLPSAASEEGFVPLFNGRDLSGWQLINGVGSGYIVRDGLLICPADGGGNLYTDREYSDFVLRFDFRLDKAGNNGVALRVPEQGGAAYAGMEIQILDDDDPIYKDLEPGQYCGSIYKVAPAKRGSLNPPGQWNSQEIIAIGRRITIRINGKTVVDADLNKVSDPAVIAQHPGIFRESGFLGFAGHGPSEVALRNIRIRDLSKNSPDNTPPAGFRAAFNGRNLQGWKGLVANPPERARMAPQQLATAQAQADEDMRAHWSVVDGVLTFDGRGQSIVMVPDYADFEMLVDWKIGPEGDSGVYLRGTPQVQIWDREEGSGGLYNNQDNPRNPLKKADNPVGQWNRFRIVMVGEKVHVFLNGQLVVDNVTMENYWERDKPIYPRGQIELQNHGNPLYFKNIYIRKIRKQ